MTLELENKVNRILSLLDAYYPAQTKCFLDYEKPYELLFATILSAQCTDDRVNMVTSELFKKYPTLEAFASADLSEMEKDVKSTGFYHNKAQNIILSARKLLNEFNGEMPSDIEILTSFAGVGRKTANVVRGHIFNIPSIVVDTHVKRISKRLGLTEHEDPTKVEMDLMRVLPESSYIQYNTQVITFGREICKSQRPKCSECFLVTECVCSKK